MAPPIRILLVDSPTLIRRCIALTLGRRRQLAVVGEAGSGSAALERAHALQPDVVVVDPAVPEGGPQLVETLRREAEGAAILVLTAGGSSATPARALHAGALGYLHKDCEPPALIEAIERVSVRQLVVGSAHAETIAQELGTARARAGTANGLTGREMEVAQLVASGMTNPEVARQLFITEHTVKSHLATILGKLGLDNRVQLAAYATQHGVAVPPRASSPA
ncbi:MAG: two-component system, NarL family, nitrate/nitrite response regulator NarL [Chloroflexota bacterium]|jgi:DNA-binding NarL/FixJ family response regulator|nr:two-component system, NarL family, nitrate/nitrite response regulator NarL [Chloroflexota bacterium]